MGDSLKIQVIVDASQVAAGMGGVSASVDAATAKIKASFGSVEKAPEGIRNALLALQNQGRMSAEAIQFATASIAELGGGSSAAAPKVAAAGTAAASATTQFTSMDRAMAMASARASAMAGGLGGLGMTLGRVASASTTLGPILAAAFPVIAIGIAVDLLAKAYEGLRNLSFAAERNAEAWRKIDHESTVAMEGATKAIQRLDDRIVELTQGKMAALRLEMTQINDGSIEMSGHLLSFFDQMGTTLDKQISLWDKFKTGVKDVTSFMQGGAAVAAGARPGFARTTGDDSKKFGADLSETLDTKGLAAGIDLVTEKIRMLNGEIAKDPGNKGMQEYADQLVKVLGLLEQRVTIENKEKQVNRAEQQAEANKEELTAIHQAEQYNAAIQKLANEKARLSDATKKLAEDEAKFGDEQENKQLEAALRDTVLLATARGEAERQWVADVRDASIAALDIKERQVQEEIRTGKLSADQGRQQLNDLAAQKLAIEKKYIADREAEILPLLQSQDAKVAADAIKEQSKLLSDKLKAEQKYNAEIEKNAEQSETKQAKTWEKLQATINRTFDQAIHGLLSGTERFGTAFARMFDQLLGDFASFLANMALKWAENHLLMLAAHSTWLSNILGLDTANNTAKAAEGATAAALQVTQQAGIAGASGFASVMASLPFPANVALAPEVMASSIATTLSNLSLASAAGGMWQVPGDMLAMVHKDESILPAAQAQGLRNLVSGGAGGDVHIHYNISAMDSRGVEGVLEKNSAALTRVIRRELRRTNAI